MHFLSARNVRMLKRRSLFRQAVVTVLGAELLFLSGFTAFDLPTATGRNLQAWGHNLAFIAAASLPLKYQQFALSRFPDLSVPPQPVRRSLYSPIVPTALFTGYILGPLLGVSAAALYVLAGLLGPLLGVYLFAAGGGLTYYHEPGMGYLLGLLPGCWCMGRLTGGQSKSLRQLLGVACSVSLIHIVGIGYLLAACIASNFSGTGVAGLPWRPWIFEELRNLSWYQLPYDLLFSLLLVGIAFPFRRLVSALIAPDASTRISLHTQLEELIR